MELEGETKSYHQQQKHPDTAKGGKGPSIINYMEKKSMTYNLQMADRNLKPCF